MILGICIGHQLLAKVLKGNVIENPNGWEVGSGEIELTKAGLKSKLFFNFPLNFYAAETHKDIVIKLPQK